MLFNKKLLILGMVSVGIAVATTAHAGNQLFEASWNTKSFGNELSGGTGASEYYTAFGIPGGIQCNANQPRCPFVSTPTDGGGSFAPLGGSQDMAKYCAPWANWGGGGATARPAKGYTLSTGTGPIPPLYRNPVFFTSSGQPGTTECNATSTGATPGGKGLVQAGSPVAGSWGATTTGTQLGGFSFGAAPAGGSAGIKTVGQIGEFEAVYPYVYSYTYATLRNDAGVFGPGKGPGNFDIQFQQGANTVASINVKQGAAKFGGTMRMLGAYTTKVCYFRNGGCSIGRNNWRYDAVGASAYTSGSVVTDGYLATYKAYYYHTALMQKSTINVEGDRFPWTTGSVTLTATGRGPHKTIHYTQGFDNRKTSTSLGKGTIQLVTPVITRWLQPAANFETGGVGILRINFVPEPQTWAMLLAGVALLGAGYRARGR
jgi:hypothetical protein